MGSAGARFLLAITLNGRRTDGELDEEQLVAADIGSLQLTLKQMTALINDKKHTVADCALWAKHAPCLRKQKKSGGKYLSYQHFRHRGWDVLHQPLKTKPEPVSEYCVSRQPARCLPRSAR